ncbi:MAG: glycoside hydrolase family 32 protein [Clostridiales bacterium]|nr:glycoside hydrolase family 32 protein [Candidatus Blautia equi]
MLSQTLREARKYEEAFGKTIKNEERAAFHLGARIGWMNDPNGFCYHDGKYHMFYQYHPYDSHWGPMHWGHAVSEDLLHWDYLPAALAPDEFYDKDGCFSGSAITLPDGRHLLMYTGVVKEFQSHGGFAEVQTQCLAIGDGIDYEKYEGNPVLDEHDVPEGSSRFDFRDPKIFKGDNGIYYAVVGNRPADGSGQILLFSSEDAFHWKFKKILVENKNRYGKMWECPDFFKLDGKWVLLTSPQDMLPENFEYHNGNGTLCLIGDMDEVTFDFQEQFNQSIDYGIDFYAPQTVVTPDGRRVMIGWMQNWDTCGPQLVNQPWFGQMSLPRELHVKNGRLYQMPIREIESLYGDKISYHDVKLNGEMVLDGIHGRKVDMEITLRPEAGADLYEGFKLCFAQNDQYRTTLSFHPKDSILKIDRKFSGSRRAFIHQRRSKVNGEDGNLKLRVILDNYSVEVFVNDGEQAVTATLFTDVEAEGISFVSDGKIRMDVVKYELK